LGTNVRDTYDLIGSAVGPHPFPTIVRDFQSVTGREMRAQMLEKDRLPDAIVACVGGGSNAIGAFHPFIDDKEVAFYGAEVHGHGDDIDEHCATLSKGTPCCLAGALYLHPDAIWTDYQHPTVSAGLPSVGPEYAHLKDIGARLTWRLTINKPWRIQLDV
jgi:tryptophan synthase beta subunit